MSAKKESKDAKVSRKTGALHSCRRYATGAMKSVPDVRDYDVRVILDLKTKVPDTLDYRSEMLPIADQGKTSTCVSQTAKAIKEWQERKQSGGRRRFEFSAQYVYDQRKNAPEEGMMGRDVVKILAKSGICSESQLPFGTALSSLSSKQRVAVDEEAKSYRLKGYGTIKTNQTEADDPLVELKNGSAKSNTNAIISDETFRQYVKVALTQYGPCTIIVDTTYNIDTQTAIWVQPRRNAVSYGGHAMTLVGYTKKGFIVRNSWGTEWNAGDEKAAAKAGTVCNGYVLLPFADMSVSKKVADEVWIMLDDTAMAQYVAATKSASSTASATSSVSASTASATTASATTASASTASVSPPLQKLHETGSSAAVTLLNPLSQSRKNAIIAVCALTITIAIAIMSKFVFRW